MNKRIAQAQKDHERALRRLGVGKYSKKERKGVISFPDLSVNPSAPTSDRIVAISNKRPTELKERLDVSKNFTVSVAYNKGPYMVVSQDNVKDIGR